MQKKEKVVILDTSGLFREGLGTLCKTMGFEILAELASIDILQEQADLVSGANLFILELGAIENNPETAISSLRRLSPSSRIVVLAQEFTPYQLKRAFGAGVDGFLIKSISSEILLESLKLVLLGEKVFPARAIDLMTDRYSVNSDNSMPIAVTDLSTREIQILKFLIEGKSNKHIAIQLHITEATVKAHLKNILRKAHVKNRTQAAIWALKKGVYNQSPSVAAQDNRQDGPASI